MASGRVFWSPGTSSVRAWCSSRWTERGKRTDLRFLFSGDLGHYDQPIVKDPAPPPACDYLMVESTYGNRLHGDVSSADQMARIINEAAERGGPILIPAFAVGRTQEVLYLIRELEDEKRIPCCRCRRFADGRTGDTGLQPLDRRARRGIRFDPKYEAHPLKTASMRTASTRDESKRLNDMQGARIIISASGMMTGGRVLHHAVRMVPDENATVIFVGFQAAGTTGRRVQDGEKEVKIMKQLDSGPLPRRKGRRLFRPRRLEGRDSDGSKACRLSSEDGVYHTRRTRSRRSHGRPHSRPLRLERRRAGIPPDHRTNVSARPPTPWIRYFKDFFVQNSRCFAQNSGEFIQNSSCFVQNRDFFIQNNHFFRQNNGSFV
jgi:hypothetical protein